jgi:hypothetical protein
VLRKEQLLVAVFFNENGFQQVFVTLHLFRIRSRHRMWMVLVFAIREIAEADAHVVIQRTGNGDGDGNAEDSVADGWDIEVAIA